MSEIEDSTTRISTLVGAAKQYSQMDRAPHQDIDVHELLDSTLTMLGAQDRRRRSRWSRTTTETLPTIPAYAAELNQVWTNLIDNAVHGDGRRRHADRPHRAGTDDCVLVEICDTGPGVPTEMQPADLRAVLHHQAGR